MWILLDFLCCWICWKFRRSSKWKLASIVWTTNPRLHSKSRYIESHKMLLIWIDQCGGTGGCGGGTYELAWNQIKESGGLLSEWQYPYVSYYGENFQCHLNTTKMTPTVKVVGYVDLPSNELEPVISALSTIGPMVSHIQIHVKTHIYLMINKSFLKFN